MKKIRRLLFILVLAFFCLGNAMAIQGKTVTLSKKNFPDAYIRKTVKKYDKNHDGNYF